MQRELLEETGYISPDWHRLGTYAVDGARHRNRMHAYLAFDAQASRRQQLDDGEIIEIHHMPWNKFLQRLAEGELSLDACQLACLFWLQAFARSSADPRAARLRVSPST
jgi:8-oxo-dGTP pyrophosphatase MutT (NUDIX family)